MVDPVQAHAVSTALPPARPALGWVAAGVFMAGGFGAVLRTVTASWIDRLVGHVLPHGGTLAVNLLGCLLIGLLGSLLSGPARVVFLGGFLGALTTYSTFALLTTELAGEGRLGVLAVQLLAHLVGGALCVVAGLALARALAPLLAGR